MTSYEIEQEISKLNVKKAVGLFSIPTSILKKVKNLISKPLEVIFNASFQQGLVPDKFKLARVIPVYKAGSRTYLNNYRPISLLPIFSKLIESLMLKRLTKFVNTRNIIYDKQFGFRANHSTEHAILTTVEQIQSAIDRSEYGCGIFLDFSKAFDTVNHQILLRKLDNYGIRGIAKDWFASYLINRNQIVSIGSKSSNVLHVNCGVPQGSLLGPLLFLIYINDFKSCTKLDLHLFADDSNFFLSKKDLATLESVLNAELEKIFTWLCANKLSLNVDKSNFVIFHARQKIIQQSISLKINGLDLKQEKCIKYLGIFIDSNLRWKTQVDYVCKKIRRSIGLLSKIRFYVNQKTLINLYYALIYPYVCYGLIAWGSACQTTLQPLITLQKKAVRIITCSKFDDHSSPLFKATNIVKITDLFHYQICVFMHNFYNNQLPAVFSSFFMQVTSIHNYNTRHAANHSYSLPKIKTNYGLSNIKYRGPHTWNSLNKTLKQSHLRKFKKSFLYSYIEKY